MVRACHEKDEEYVGKRVVSMDVEGRRRKGRLKMKMDGQCKYGLE